MSDQTNVRLMIAEFEILQSNNTFVSLTYRSHLGILFHIQHHKSIRRSIIHVVAPAATGDYMAEEEE